MALPGVMLVLSALAGSAMAQTAPLSPTPTYNIFAFAGTGLGPGYAGNNGPATSARINTPTGLAVDSRGAVYISEMGNCVVRVVSNDTLSVAAGIGCGWNGNGLATAIQLSTPAGIALDSSNNLYIGEWDDDEMGGEGWAETGNIVRDSLSLSLCS